MTRSGYPSAVNRNLITGRGDPTSIDCASIIFLHPAMSSRSFTKHCSANLRCAGVN
jgi:hypothetical protein